MTETPEALMSRLIGIFRSAVIQAVEEGWAFPVHFVVLGPEGEVLAGQYTIGAGVPRQEFTVKHRAEAIGLPATIVFANARGKRKVVEFNAEPAEAPKLN